MAYMKMLRAMKVVSEDAKRMMRVGVRNARRDCRTEAAEDFFSVRVDISLETDAA